MVTRTIRLQQYNAVCGAAYIWHAPSLLLKHGLINPFYPEPSARDLLLLLD